jgi:chemotaxis protein methyltransferase CheR
MAEIGIVETKNIIATINDKYHIDFSDYALTSFKRRIERVMDNYNFKYHDLLINRLVDDPRFLDTFIYETSVPSSEMFRDPSLWRLLRDEILPALVRENSQPLKIWLPNSVSGDELFSLAIVLHEMDLLGKVQIFVSVLSDRCLEIIKAGIISPSKLEISTDNYVRANGKGLFSNYFAEEGNMTIRKTDLIKDVTFLKQDITLSSIPQGIKLVFYRNKMIYFNQVLQWKVLKNISQAMVQGGLFIIGTKETLSNIYTNTDFTLISDNESIYRKK